MKAQDCDPSGVTQSAVVCDGDLASFVIGGLAAGETYNVDFDIDGGGPDGTGFSLMANASGEVIIQVNITAADDGATFAVPQVTQLTGVTCTNSAPLPGGLVSTTVQVNSEPIVTVVDAPASPVCLNTEMTHIATSVPASPGTGSYTYVWQGCNGVNGAGGCNPSGIIGSGDTINRVWGFSGTKSIEVVVSTPGCPDVTAYGNFTISTTTALVSGDIVENAVCSGDTLSIDPTTAVTSGTASNFDFNWATTSTITNALSGVGSINGTVTNNDTAQEDVVYVVTPVDNTGSNCSSTPFTVTLPVDPFPTGDPSAVNDTICSPSKSNLTYTVSVGDAFFVTSSASGVTGNTASRSGLTSGSVIDTATLTNAGTTAGTVSYFITPYSFGHNTTDEGGAGDDCLGASDTVVVVVEPVPDISFAITAPYVVTLNSGSPNLVATVCNGTIATGAAATAVTPSRDNAVFVKVDLTDAQDLMGLGGTGIYYLPVDSAKFTNLSLDITGNSDVTLSAILTPYIETDTANPNLDGGECSGAKLSFTITILASPDATPSALTEVICTTDTPKTTVTLNAGDKYLVEASLLSGTATGFTPSATKNSGDAIDNGFLLNTSNTDAVVRYIITPYSFGPNGVDSLTSDDDCVGEKDTVDVTIRPVPNYSFSILGDTLNSSNTAINASVCNVPSNIPVTAITQGTSSIAAAKLGVRFEATGTNLFLNAIALSGTPYVVEGSMADFNTTPLWSNQPLALRLANSSLATARTATFTITPFYDENEDGMLNNNECEGTPYIATITVNPRPELSFVVNGTTVTADNDLITPDNTYSFEVCDTANNLTLSNPSLIVGPVGTSIFYEELSRTNVDSIGNNIFTIGSFPTGAYSLTLTDPSQPGQYVFRVTPYNEIATLGFDPADDCGGEPMIITIDILPVPAVEIDVNGTTVTSDPKSGADANSYTFDLCKGGTNNIVLDNLNQINATDSTRIRLEVIENTNTNGDPMGTVDDQFIGDIAAGLPLSLSLSAVNPSLPGVYKVIITPYRESGDAAGIDADDCVGETDTVIFNVVSAPEVSIVVNTVTVTADNDLGTIDNAYTFEVCDVNNNLDLSAIATVVNSPNTFIRTEIDVNTNVIADPQGTISSQSLTAFQSQLPTIASLRLANSALPGIYRMLITPFFESGDQAGLDVNDCPGEQISVTINVTPTPDISLEMNGRPLATLNNGQRDAVESVDLTVCNGKNNVTFSNLTQDNSSPNPAITVAFTNINNVTLDGNTPASITSPLGPLLTLLSSPQSSDVELVNAGMPGQLDGYFIGFTDANTNDTLDASECTTDTLFFSITVNPRPEIRMTVNGDTLDNVGTNNGVLDGKEDLVLEVCHRLDSVTFTAIDNVLNVANVGVTVQISGANVNLGLPLPLSFDETLANFNAQLPSFAPAGLDLMDSSLIGQVAFAITPFDDINANGDLDLGECEGDPINVFVSILPIPFLSIDVNGQTIQTDNDSSTAADRRDTIIVCNEADNLLLSPISRINGVNLGALEYVQIRVVNQSNVNNPLGTDSITAPVDVLNAGPLNGGLLTTLQLVNSAVDGFFSLELIPFVDWGFSSPGFLGPDDCPGEGGILTIKVGAIPPDLSEYSCPGNDPNCGRIQIRYCENEPNPASYSSFIVGPTDTNSTYQMGNQLRWYADSAGNTSISEPTPNVSGSGGNGPYWVSQFDPATGCESGLIEVRTWVRPEVTINVTQPSQAVCEGDTLDLFAQIASTGGNAAAWLTKNLYYAQGDSAATATPLGSSGLAGPSPLTLADPNDTLYWVYRLDEYPIGGACSSDTISIKFEVNASPVVAASAAALACKGDTIFLFENGGAAAGWSWTGPDGFMSSQQNDTIANAQAINEGRYYVTIADTNGCTNTDSVDVSFQTTLNLGLAVSDTLYCPPAPATASITLSNAEAGVSYIIEALPAGTALDTVVGTGNDLSFTFGMPGATTFYQVVAEDGGCRDTLLDQGSVSPTDTVEPVLTCPLDQDVIANASCVTLANYEALVTVSDNCATGLMTSGQFPTAGTTVQDTTEITIFADDGNGNVGSCTFNVNVVDQTPPTISNCPLAQFASVNANCQGVIVNFVPTVIVTDNCDPAPVVVQTPGPGTLVGIGTTAVSITATDLHGQSSTCNFTVTIDDQTPPTISCPSDTTIGLSFLNCDANLSDYTTLATVSDNCATNLSPSQTPAPGTLLNGRGVTAVTLSVTDGATAAVSCTFNVTAIDTFAPIVTGPINQSIYRGAGCVATLPDWTASGIPLGFAHDGCDGFFLAQVQSPPSGLQFFEDTTFTVYLFATDSAGNTGVDSFLVTVVDTTGPSISCPQNDTVAVDTGCAHTLKAYSAVSASDNCGPVTVVQSPSAGITVSANQTITLTGTDTSNNTTSCTFEVVLNDSTTPSIICPGNQTLTANAQCNFLLPDYSTSAIPSDNCAVDTVIQTPAGGSVLLLCANAVEPVTLTVYDEAGNATSCSFTVTLKDITPPSIVSCAPDTFIYADASCMATLGDYKSLLVADDNCGVPSLLIDQAPFAGFPINAGANGSRTVVLTATDASGNQTSCTFNVTVLDTIAPTLSCPMIDTVAMLGASCEGPILDYTNLIPTMDNCDAGSLIITQTVLRPSGSPSSFADTAEIRVFASDLSGNTDSCTFIVVVADSTAPVISCMGDTTVAADGNCQGQVPDFGLSSVTATDNCDTAVTITQSVFAGTNFSDSILVELVAMDDAGNTDTCEVIVYAKDTTPPMVTCPLPQQLPANAACQAILPNYVVQGLAFATDNCTPIDTIFQTPEPGDDLLGLSTFPITVTAIDTFGNVGSCTFTVTTIDTTAPIILCAQPASDTIYLDGTCREVMPDFTGLASANDNCSNSPAPAISQLPLPGDTLSGAGTQMVVLTATDDNNNSSSCTFSITLVDTLAPSISCPGDSTVAADANCEYIMTDFTGLATASDNCDQPSVFQIPVVGSAIPLGDTTVSIFAVDNGGNTDSCSFVLTVEDTTKPVIICPSDTVAAADSVCAAAIGNYISEVSVSDNCSQSATVLQLPLPGTAFLTDSQIVQMTAIDTAGNQSNCTFWVVKKDTTPPSIMCPSVTYTVTADAFCNGELADYRPVVAGSFSDNCSPTNLISITQSPDSGTFIGGVGNSQVVTMTATDTSGNAASCTLTVTVVDLTPASFSCPSDTTLIVDANCDAFLYDIASGVQATDNCGTPTVSQFPIAGITVTGHNTSVNVRLYVDDGNGNVDSSCVVKVTAIDTLPPTFTCPATDTVDVMNNISCDAMVPDYSSLLAADNCALSVSITQAPLAGTVFTEEDTAKVYFADGNGNMDSCEIVLIVRDTVAPSISCPNDTVVYADALCRWSAIAFDTLSTFSTADNCDPDPDILQAPLAGSLFGKGVTPVTLVSTDAFNNSRFCVFNVTVLDTLGPVMTCPTDRVLSANPICQAILPDYRSLVTAVDNCDGSRPITQSLPPGINVTGGGGPVAITMTSSDVEGNVSTCSFNVILADNIGPNITGCPGDTTVYLGSSCEYTLADFGALITAVDACGGGVTKNQVPTPGTLYTAGTTFGLTIVAADAANNQNTCTFQVTVADSTAPTIVCNPIEILLDQSGNYMLDADDIAAITNGSSDNCTDSAGLARFVFPTTFSCADVGVPTSVIASVSDASVNTANCTTTVVVKPTPMTGIADIITPDTAICEGDTISLRASAAHAGQTGLWTLSSTGTFLPNDQDSLARLADLPAGTNQLIWTITDQCIASADTITVVVNARPELVASEIVSISTPGGSDGELEAVTIAGSPISWNWSNGAPSNDTAFNLNAGTYWVIGTDANGCSSDTAFVTLFDPAASGVSLSVRAALEGPYDDGSQLMNDFLRISDLIPTTDPYAQGATVDTMRLNDQANDDEDIVDWVLVQLYDTVGTGNGGYGSLVGEQAALLRRDGFIVDPATDLPLVFSGVSNDAYHVIVKHRNHLAIGTDVAINLSSSVTLVDFFNGAVAAFNGVVNTSTSGKTLMISGNTTGDGQIDAIDIFEWSLQNGTFNVYNNADLDLNGQVDAIDPFGTWVINNGKFTTLP
jgi:hypothetical protein